MKKLFFFFLAASFYTLPSLAQDFAEEDLIGTWEVEETSGKFVFRLPYEMEFYTAQQHAEQSESLGVARFRTSEEKTYTRGMQDYFLYVTAGGGLRLHLQLQGGHLILRYIVTISSQDKIELMTYDKQGKAVFRRKVASSVRGVMADRRESDCYYNLKGEKLASKPKKGIYINNGKKINAHN